MKRFNCTVKRKLIRYYQDKDGYWVSDAPWYKNRFETLEAAFSVYDKLFITKWGW